MKLFLYLALFSTILVSCGKQSPGTADLQVLPSNHVIGKDDRVKLSHNNILTSKIVLIEGINKKGQPGFCTGSLVGENLVLTNAHCTQLKKMQITSIAYNYPKISITKNEDIKLAARGDFLKSGKHANDWALLKIKKPWGKKLGYFKVLNQEPTDDFTYALIGYHGDIFKKTKTLAPYLSTCPRPTFIQSSSPLTNNTLSHTCDMTPGASGSPLLACTSDECFIFGVNSAERTNVRSILIVQIIKFSNQAVSRAQFAAQIEKELE